MRGVSFQLEINAGKRCREYGRVQDRDRPGTGGDVAERTRVLLAPRHAPPGGIRQTAQVPPPLQGTPTVGRSIHSSARIVRVLSHTVLARVLYSKLTGCIVPELYVHHGGVRDTGPLRSAHPGEFIL